MRKPSKYQIAILVLLISSLGPVQQVLALNRVPLARGAATEGRPYSDDDDGIIQAAKEGLTNVNVDTKASLDAVRASLLALRASVISDNNELVALLSKIQAISQHKDAVNYVLLRMADFSRDLAEAEDKFAERTDDEINSACEAAAASLVSQFAKLISELEHAIEEARAKGQSTTTFKEQIQTLVAAREKALSDLQKVCSRTLAEVKKQQESLAKLTYLRTLFRVLTEDPTKRSQLVALIHKGDRTAISDLLKRIAGGGDFVINDSKDINGVFVVFRVDTITHCLSARLQCSGKAYSFSR
jgi:hypothetical protein